MGLLNDPDHWLKRAEEARTLARGFQSLGAQDPMLRVAAGYERLAKQAALLQALPPPLTPLLPRRPE
jgi:hypothetical protein